MILTVLGNPFVLLTIGLVVVIAGYCVAMRYLSPEAKAERRRRRSNAPIKSNVRRPMIKFSVKTKKDRK